MPNELKLGTGGRTMREILFRGKRVGNGEWVEGSLLTDDSLVDPKKWTYDIIGKNERRATERYFVITETIGQYTGLTDKNGKKIFEGDIVKDNYGYSYVIKYGRHDLSCCGCCFQSHDSMGFYLCSQPDYALSEENVWDDLEKIGNIHDNPELLKEGADNG